MVYSNNFVRHDRIYIHLGGIAFYIKPGLNSKIVWKSDEDSGERECSGVSCVEVSANNPKYFVMWLYNPNKCKSLYVILGTSDEVSVAYEDIIFCRDFNVDMLLNDVRAR